MHESDAQEEKASFKAEAEDGDGKKDPVGGKRDFDGAQPYDRGRGASLYPEMQYGQRDITDRDGADGNRHDKIVGNQPRVLCDGKFFVIVMIYGRRMEHEIYEDAWHRK